MAADEIRAMSESLAADPSSLIFLALAETLLARGDLSHAARVAQRGATRHPLRIEAHDLVARIALAQGDETRAEAAWQAVLRIDPSFGTAHRGLGLLRYRHGMLNEAMLHLTAASTEDPHDATVRAALDAVRGVIAARATREADANRGAPESPAGAVPDSRPLEPQGPASAARVFDPVLAGTKLVALLLDTNGLVEAGQYFTSDGTDLGAEIGAHLSGVGEEAERAMRHFKLGLWTRMSIETEAATIAMAPAGISGTSALLVAAPSDVPLGFVRRTMDRCAALAADWIPEDR